MAGVKKSVAPKIINMTVVPSGGTAYMPPRPASESVCLADRTWQPEAYSALVEEMYRRLLAPTGAGKSMVMRAILWADALKRRKVIAAVPMTIIGQSFRNKNIVMPDGSLIEWAPHERNRLFKGDSSAGVEKSFTKALLRFVREPVGATPASRIALCTHNTLREVHKALMDCGEAWEQAGPISLALDEAQLIHAGDTRLDEEGHEVPDDNVNGEVVRYWLDHKVGPLLLATATWMRADTTRILPEDELASFSKYHLTADRYLEMFPPGFEVVFSYAIGAVEDVLRHLFNQPGPTPKVMDFMRRADRLVDDVDDGGLTKFDLLARRLAVLGPASPGPLYTEHEHPSGRLIRSLDLVTPGHDRDVRVRALQHAIETRAVLPDYTSAILIGQMGMDFPDINTVIIERKRTHNQTTQMGGRGLRIVPGKMRVDIITVLDPPRRDHPEYVARVRDILKTMLASMVVEWQFRPISMPTEETEEDVGSPASGEIPPDVVDLIRDPAFMEPILNACADAGWHVHESAATADGAREVIQREVERALPGDENAARHKVMVTFLQKEFARHQREQRMLLLHSADEVPDDILAASRDETLFGVLRLLSFSLGAERLSALRTRLEFLPLSDLEREVLARGIRNQAEYERRYTEIDGAPPNPGAVYSNFSWPRLFGAKGLDHLRRRAR